MRDTIRKDRRRLGQFVDVDADAPVVDVDAVRGALDEITLALEGWTELTDDERDERWATVIEHHGATVLALSSEQIEALDDDQRVALLAALTLTAASRSRLAVSGVVVDPPSASDVADPAQPAPAEPAVPPGPDVIVEPEPVPVVAATDTEYTDDRWHAIIFVEGVRTNDGRMAAPGGISTRPLPLPMQYLTKTTYGHEDAEMGGSIETLMRDPILAERLAEGGFVSLADGAMLLVAEGDYIEGENGDEFRGMVNRQELRFVSADLEILEAEEYLIPGGDPDNYSDWALLVTRGNVMGATACPFPAFQQCVIAPLSMDLFEAATQGMGEIEPPSTEPAPVAVAAAGGPAVPPAEWFTNPRFGADDRVDSRLVEDPDFEGKFYCPMTIATDGRILGHAAVWHRDHIGYGNRRVRPPHSSADYAYFATGTIEVALTEGTDVVRCGVITMDTGHAPLSGAHASAAATKRHYDDTGTVIADIEIGEDEHGIWYSGSLRTDVPDDKLRAFRAAAVSGDWRPINAASEMVGLLAVNTPGFPLPRPRRSYRVEDDQEVELALVAAGFVPPRDPMHDAIHREVQAELAPIRKMLESLTPLALAQLNARLGD